SRCPSWASGGDARRPRPERGGLSGGGRRPMLAQRGGLRVDQSSSTKVIFRLTRYSEISPPLTTTFCSWTQAPSTLLRVLSARATAFLMASSKLTVEEAVTSVTRAMDMAGSLDDAGTAQLAPSCP